MFEDIIQKKVKEVLDIIDTSQEFIYLTEIITNPDIPEPYKIYFTAEVDWWIYEERLRRQSQSHFDFTNYEFGISISKIDDLLKKYARFKKAEFETILNSAVKLRINMLIRPRTTLKWFVYRGELTKPVNEILQRLSYFYDYGYLWEGFLKWGENKKINFNSNELLSLNDFLNTIEKIDNDEILDFTPQNFVDLLDPLFSFFIEDKNTNEIPVESILIFLDDKGIEPIAAHLLNLITVDNKLTISKQDFLKIILVIIDEFDKSDIDNKIDNKNDENIENISTIPDFNISDEIIEAAPIDSKADIPYISEFEETDEILKDLNLDEIESTDIDESSESENSDFDNNINELYSYIGIGGNFENIDKSFSEFLKDKSTIADDENSYEETSVITDLNTLEFTGDRQENNEIEDFYNKTNNFNDNSNIDFTENNYSEELINEEFGEEKNANQIISDEEAKDLSNEFFNENQKAKILKKLFMDDIGKFQGVLLDISLQGSWQDAANIIDLFFAENNIDAQSSIAIEFTNSIMNKFINYSK
jgi:hypothetical protein